MAFLTGSLPWQDRLDLIVSTMREVSAITDPQKMVEAYGSFIDKIRPSQGYVSVSRRGLAFPQFRITRYHGWTEDIDPWKDKHKLPLLSGGMIADLIYGEEPQVLELLSISEDDPAYPYLKDFRSMVAVPHFDQGKSLNMILILYDQPSGFNMEELPEFVWTSNLFGRGVNNLVLSRQLKQAYDTLDRELMVVADIQRGLLPASLPEIPGARFAAAYDASRRAGGDYYDFFPLPDGHVGVFVADVSGHGTPAAVVMAITHSLAHAFPGPAMAPDEMLKYLNQKLSSGITPPGTFVTAFYGIYNPESRTLVYASAGHHSPLLRQADGAIVNLEQTAGLPLGILPDAEFQSQTRSFSAGECMLIYTDGITEAFSPSGEMFSLERLHAVMENLAKEAQDAKASISPQAMTDAVMAAVDRFTAPQKAEDDRTLVAIAWG